MRKDKMDFEATEMATFIGNVLKLVEIGIKKNMKPEEVARYATDVFKAFQDGMMEMEGR